MAAVQETIDQVKKIDVDQYKYGFETNDRSHSGARRASTKATCASTSEKKGRAGVDASVAPRGVCALARHDRAHVGEGPLSEAPTSRTSYYYSAPQGHRRTQEPC